MSWMNCLLVFDLDGTLADTLDDVARAMNHALLRHDRRPIPVSDYRALIGSGPLRLAEQILGDCPTDVRDAVVADCLEFYERHLLDQTAAYPGTVQLLCRLRDQGARMAVLSNKPHRQTCVLVEALFPSSTFVSVQGASSQWPPKPNPASLRAVLDDAGVHRGFCALVGDTEIDLATARAGGVTPVGVSWGFRDAELLRAAGAAFVAATPCQLEEYLHRCVALHMPASEQARSLVTKG